MLDDYIKGSDARVAQWSAARREAFSEAVAVIERTTHPSSTRPGHFTEPITLMGACITCQQPKRPQDLLAHSGKCRECYKKRGEKKK
jgi:hypothetical protein